MLQGSMRFSVLAIIDVVCLVVGIVTGIGMAVAGYGYWALVAMTISQPAASVLGTWVASGWVPGMPRRRSGIRSMVPYGGGGDPTQPLRSPASHNTTDLPPSFLG